MGRSILGAMTALAILGALAAPVSAQTASGAAPQGMKPGPAATASPTSKREPTAGQMAARERQKKCGAEWREAKAGGKTGGLKWPQYWSQCNARLKGSHV